MAISTNDYFLKVGNPGTATTLSAPGYTIGNPNINVATTGNFPADSAVIFGIDTAATTTGTQVRTPNSYCVFVGIVTSATSIGSVTLLYGTPQNYTASALTRVYITVSSVHINRLVSGILNFANPDATLKTSAVQAALNLGNATNTGLTPFGATMTYTGNNGNKEYTANIAADVTSFLPVGAKIAVTRGTTPPTQSTAFTASSSQYASKTSPTGITSTSTLTVEDWVYVNSYPTGDVGIVSRHDGTNGFIWGMTAAGQPKFFNGSVSSQTAYQSLPLKRWVHRAAVFSSGTMTLYLNGSVVSSSLTGSGSTITQAGNLQLGAYNSTHFFDGYISEARIWSTAKTQSEIQANMNISLSGSETGLVALFQGNGNFNDKTSNANNLTPSGGAIATQAANPMNAVEYFKVTKVGTYSGGVTPVTLFGGTDCNLPNMTLTGAQYSNVDKPFGFPASRSKWTHSSIWKIDAAVSLPSASTWYNASFQQVTLPTGDWLSSTQYNLQIVRSSAADAQIWGTLSTANNSETNKDWTTFADASGLTVHQTMNRQLPLSVTSPTTYYLNIKTDLGSGVNDIHTRGDLTTTIISAELTY